jgi:hypothetical protein
VGVIGRNLVFAIAVAGVLTANTAWAGGWYLMAAPFFFHQRITVDIDAPLWKWTVSGAYDTASECTIGQLEYIRAVKRIVGTNPSTAKERAVLREAITSECIATDDPRLKGN